MTMAVVIFSYYLNQLKENGLNELNIGEKVSFKKQKKGNKFTLLI
jgi:hypothetical protein